MLSIIIFFVLLIDYTLQFISNVRVDDENKVHSRKTGRKK